MAYTNASYVNSENTTISVDINGVTSFVPCVAGNSDYAAIEALVAAGELTIAPYVPPPAPPVIQVTMRQARLALLAADLLDDVETMITKAPKNVQIEWEYATVVDRNSALVLEIGNQLGLTTKQMDQMFQEASVL